MLNEISPLKMTSRQIPFMLAMIQQVFKDGAEFGYAKANEWHNINDTEPSKEQLGKQLLIRMESVIGDTDYDYLVYKYSGESITDVPGVIAWKEIIPPKEIESC